MVNLSACWGGRGYYNQTWPADENIAEGVTRAEAVRALGERAAAAPYGVGVLHTGLDLDPVKAPTDPAVLMRAGFDYWPLGTFICAMPRPRTIPSGVFGCIQGRDIKETGRARREPGHAEGKARPTLWSSFPPPAWCGSAWTWTSPTARTFPR